MYAYRVYATKNRGGGVVVVCGWGHSRQRELCETVEKFVLTAADLQILVCAYSTHNCIINRLGVTSLKRSE